jgi:hypothetical protein
MSRALVFWCLVVGCRALPSSTPLADTGEGRSVDDGALSRNRVPLSGHSPKSDDSDDDFSRAEDSVTIVAAAGDAGDAGTSDAGALPSDAGDAAGLWAGEYFGSDRHKTRLSGQPERVELDDKAHTRVEEPAPGSLLISLVSSSDGKVICGMKARATGNRAELEPGESCAPLDLRPPLALTGKAELSGDELELDLEGHGEFPIGDDSIKVDVEYHFEGKRR